MKLGGQLMKSLKKIIHLLVLISLSLSLTPLTTAKAATTVNNALDVDTSALASSDDTQSVTAVDGKAEATSNVTVNVLSGILTLEAVPDFNFGSMMQGTTAKLKSNNVVKPVDDPNKTYGEDGNSSGLLEVIDSRNQSAKMPGFTLSATMGNLTSLDGQTSLPAILYLSGLPLVDGDNNNISTTSDDKKTEAATIKSNGASAPIISLTAGSYNAGIISTQFTTPDSASLEIPGAGDNSQQSAKNMNAVITWTLNAAPAVTE